MSVMKPSNDVSNFLHHHRRISLAWTKIVLNLGRHFSLTTSLLSPHEHVDVQFRHVQFRHCSNVHLFRKFLHRNNSCNDARRHWKQCAKERNKINYATKLWNLLTRIETLKLNSSHGLRECSQFSANWNLTCCEHTFNIFRQFFMLNVKRCVRTVDVKCSYVGRNVQLSVYFRSFWLISIFCVQLSWKCVCRLSINNVGSYLTETEQLKELEDG